MVVFLATLGQRPEAVTMALDALLLRYPIDYVSILHTDAERSGIALAHNSLMQVLKQDYEGIAIQSDRLDQPDGLPIIDITDPYTAEAYYMALLEILRQYRSQYTSIHLLVSGGRKAMSIYATLAAALVFGEHDRVWTILTPQNLMQSGMFHLPPGEADHIQMVQLPVIPSRFLPGDLAQQSTDQLLSRARVGPRTAFLRDLSEEESKLVELLRQLPYLSNADIAIRMNKSLKTVETQLTSIYDKLFSRYNLQVENKRKRQALLDVLANRV